MTCYLLDGSVADLLWPCDNSTSAHATCCPAGTTCWSNGVCMYEPDDGPTDYLRAGCTDPTWADSSCLNECEDLFPDRIIGIRPCDGIEESTNYCCDDGKKGPGSFHCCNNDDEIFKVGKDVPTILTEMPTVWTTAAEDMTATPGTTETETEASSGGDEEGSSANIGVPIGVGVGVGLPAAALVIGAVIFFMRRNKKKAAAAAAAAGTAAPHDATAVTQPLPPKWDGSHAPPMYGQSPIYQQQSPVYPQQSPSPVYPQHTPVQHAPVEIGPTQSAAKHELP